MHISDWKPPEMQDPGMQDGEAEAQDRALLRLQAMLLAASVAVVALATAFNGASGHLACAVLAIAPC